MNQQFSFLSSCFPSTHTMFLHWNLHNIILFNTENPEGLVEKTVGVHFSASFVSRENKDSCETIPKKACFTQFAWHLCGMLLKSAFHLLN